MPKVTKQVESTTTVKFTIADIEGLIEREIDRSFGHLIKSNTVINKRPDYEWERNPYDPDQLLFDGYVVTFYDKVSE